MKKIVLIAAVAVLAGGLGFARAQDYPSGPIHLISGFPAGTTADISARVVSTKMSSILGQQIVVENKGGAASSIAAAYVARAPKDGYTLFVASAANMINAAMNPSLTFDIMKDFTPITLITSTPTVLVVSPELGVKNVKELIDLAKEIRAARSRGEEEGLSEEEIGFYDALAKNESAVEIMGDDRLKVIAHELLMSLKSNITVDWAHRAAARARMRVLVKRILRKYGYPPDLQDAAVQTVLQQAEALSAGWVA